MNKFPAFIIEDDQSVANLYSEALRLAEYEPELFAHGRDALQRLQEITPALILLDLHLPDLSGEDVLTQLQADAKLAHTPVFLLTADHLFAEQLRHKADLVLLKPVSFSQLKEMAARFRPQP